MYNFIVTVAKNEEGELNLSYKKENIVFPVKEYKLNEKTIIIIGEPIFKEKINNESLINNLKRENKLNIIDQINGQYLLIICDKKKNKLHIINDRFASIPFFYRKEKEKFIGSLNYTRLWQKYKREENFNNAALYEFVNFRRLYGNKTYDYNTKFLNSASILTYDGHKLDLKKYWELAYKPNNYSIKKLSDIFKEKVSHSIDRRTSDNKQYGIFLSGGLDSRLILALSKKRLNCYTLGDYRNREYDIAAKAATLRNFPHKFIKRPEDYYSSILSDACSVGGGMYIYYHDHFRINRKLLTSENDVIFHGHGFDYFFQGLYLPAVYKKIFGRSISIKKPLKIKGKDIVSEYVNRIKFRSKTDPMFLIKRKKERGVYGCSS